MCPDRFTSRSRSYSSTSKTTTRYQKHKERGRWRSGKYTVRIKVPRKTKAVATDSNRIGWDVRDSRVTAKDDLLDNKFDRSMKYDFAGRLKFSQFGMGTGSNNGQKNVYEEPM